jgi:hypothetical protein
VDSNRPQRFLPEWLPVACWPLVVVIALGGGYLGGAAAVVCAVGAIALAVGVTWAASGRPEPEPAAAAVEPAES